MTEEDKKVLFHTKALVKKQSDEEGVLEACVGSTDVIDRMGESIDQEGWETANFKKNPVLLWAHNAGLMSDRPPIGKVLKTWIEGARKKRLMFSVKFDLADPFAMEIARKFKDGFLNAFSVGFQPLKKEDNIYTKAELLEISAVPVPANPEALAVLREAKFETKEWPDLIKDKALTTEDIKPEEKKPDENEEEPKSEEEKPEEGKALTDDEVIKPFPNEHACRVAEPSAFEKDSFRSMERDHEGKKYRVIMGKKKGEDTMSDQSYRYPKDTWTSAEAGAHCKAHDGTFEPASDNAGITAGEVRQIVRQEIRQEFANLHKKRIDPKEGELLPELKDTLKILVTAAAIALSRINKKDREEG